MKNVVYKMVLGLSVMVLLVILSGPASATTADSTSWAGSEEMNALPYNGGAGAWGSYWMTASETAGTPNYVNVQPVPGDPGNNMVNFYDIQSAGGAMWYRAKTAMSFNFATGASIEQRVEELYGNTGQISFFSGADTAAGKSVTLKFGYTNDYPNGVLTLNAAAYPFAANSYNGIYDMFHTFRVTVLGTVAKLYIDNNPTAAITTTTEAIGDGYSSNGLSWGNSIVTNNWDYLRWTTAGAYAPVPEPVTLVLLGLGGLMARRRSA